MCPCEEKEEERTTDHLIFRCTKLRVRNQRNEKIKQIKNTGGNCPTANETLPIVTDRSL
jgi:hypothetical protein